jgi:hypothetical protein
MKLFRILLTVCAALLVVPAAASAQLQVPPPQGDQYRDPVVLGNTGSPLPLTPGVVGFDADTTNYTTEDQDPIFEGGGEYNVCGPPGAESVFGKTIWSVFYTNRTGRVDITAAGFDGVIGLHRFRSPQDARSIAGPCTDRIAGRIESFPRDNLPTVDKGGWYAVQVGGYRNPQTGEFAGGPLEVAIELLPPEQIIADAGLTWRPTSGGVRVTLVRVDGPQGSVARISCVRRSCGRQTVNNPKPVGVFAKTSFVRGLKSSGGDKYTPAKASDKPVRMATRNVFRGKKIPNGARLMVSVTSQSDDQIGQVFFWDVRNNAAGAKTLRCVNPGSSRLRTVGTCDGR